VSDTSDDDDAADDEKSNSIGDGPTESVHATKTTAIIPRILNSLRRQHSDEVGPCISYEGA
jgi:hypothetical protein